MAESTDKVIELRPADTLALFYSIDAEPKFAVKLCADATLHAAVHSVLFCEDGPTDPRLATESLEAARELAASGSYDPGEGWLELRKGMAATVAFLAEKVAEARAGELYADERAGEQYRRAEEMTAKYALLAAALRGALGDNLPALVGALPAADKVSKS